MEKASNFNFLQISLHILKCILLRFINEQDQYFQGNTFLNVFIPEKILTEDVFSFPLENLSLLNVQDAKIHNPSKWLIKPRWRQAESHLHILIVEREIASICRISSTDVFPSRTNYTS